MELQTTDFDDKEQRHPNASMVLGKNEFANLDLHLSLSKSKEIKLQLVKGSGPITISGIHLVEFFGEAEEDEDDDDTEGESSTDEGDVSIVGNKLDDDLQDLQKRAEATF